MKEEIVLGLDTDMKEPEASEEPQENKLKKKAKNTVVKEDESLVKMEPTFRSTFNDLLLFETDYSDMENYDVRKTVDYFDENLGVLKNREEPTRAEFACSLLREVLLALTEPSVLREKVKLGALLLHLSTATQEFDWLYQYYHQIESDVIAEETEWISYQMDLEVEEKIVNKVKEGNCTFDTSILRYKDVSGLMKMKFEDARTKLEEDDDDDDAMNGDFHYPDFDQSDEGDGETKKKPKQVRKHKKKGENREPKTLKKMGRPKKKEKTAGPNDEICELCKHTFKHGRALSVHMFEEHSHGSLCTQCGHPSETYAEYEKHMSTHILSCDQCEFTAVGLKRLRRHQKSHTSNLDTVNVTNSVKIPCHVCGKELTEASLPGHVANTHPDAAVQSFSCDKCDYITESRTYFLAHKQRHKKTLQQCPVCKRSVKYLNNHLNRGNCVKRKPSIPCDLCDKVFTDPYHMRRHVKVVHMKIKDIICDMCDYRTHSSFNLKLHRSKMHTKETLEQICDICHQRTMSLDHHKKTYHLEMYLKEKQEALHPEDLIEDDQKLDINPHIYSIQQR